MSGLIGDAEFDQELLSGLVDSIGAAVVWWFDLDEERLGWMPGLDAVIRAPGADAGTVRARLAELVRPLTVAAKAAPAWEDFELEQPLDTPGGRHRLQFRARVSARGSARSLVGVVADVTRRHTQQQELADLADRYRLLVELSPEAIVVHEGGRIVYANPAAVRFVRARSDAEILGRPITDFVHQDSQAEMLRRIAKLNEPGTTSDPADAVLLRFDGGTTDIESVSVRTTWEGRPAFQVIMRDVTEQKAAAAALRYQAALVAHVSDALIATTSDGVVTSWNPSAEKVYGRRAADVLGRPIDEVVGAPLDPAAVLEAGGVVQAEHHRSDGEPLAVRVSVARMDDGYVLICADETARRRAERHFTAVVAAIEEGVLVVGATGRVESVNPAAERILGVSAQEAIGELASSTELHDEAGQPIPPELFPSAITRTTGKSQHGRIVRALRPDGSRVWLSLSARALSQDGKLPAATVVSFTDITERRMIDSQLEHEATHDALTGLYNRTVTINRLSPLARAHRSGLTAVLFIDLDKFKVINDSLGHSAGDEVLRVVGTRLSHSTRRGDVVGRLGGDEFTVVAYGVAGPDEATAIADHVRAELNRPITVDGRQLHVDASVGIVLAEAGDPRDGADLLRDADLAMYEAKTRGRGRIAFFDVELRDRIQRRLQLEQDLRMAPLGDELWLAYQPIVDLRTNRRIAVEGLLRWTHPRYGLIFPGEFITLAEESDLINIVGAHMLYTATREIAAQAPELQLTVNLSARQLDDPWLVSSVRNATHKAGLNPGSLCLEITESALMYDPALAAKTLAALRELGVRLAIDDFGTGHSSLAQLLTLPLDTLKIDRSFTAGLGRSDEAEAIVTSIIAMAHAVDLTVIAEGVEQEGQLEILRALGCDQAQGYHLGRPVPLADL
ncbi:PAS domain S-box-containing protein/diguanylate cyclase (GGDEF) domain-containing protein [Lentzea xinjiangensis]|uniref:PAS domain S-box-containing protein/diguanylate cyclase (GGDEF) domain-containing protein n=1 Tax=Lentzea xinjiangensis TaxID=402600 RepID=A0A1H9UDK7_9PSEU|nr:EAL domain-containing protein [Lentzea xinjiangensis]SES07526.1 PAS domain S-box-containing protein/diguanylate cyclase (GGDEF) domain-containing protein [Lentzea xinjiangensis]